MSANLQHERLKLDCCESFFTCDDMFKNPLTLIVKVGLWFRGVEAVHLTRSRISDVVTIETTEFPKHRI